MRHAAAFFLILAVLLPGNALSQGWDMDEFVIYGSWPWDRNVDDDARAEALADAGVNVVLADEHQLDVCGRHGLRAFVEGVEPESIGRIKDHPALYGYYIMDEPLHNFDALAKIYDSYVAADPTKPAFINLISLGGEYLESFMETVEPSILSYDYYQWWWGRDGHFTKLEIYGEAAKKAGVPLFLYTEVKANPYGLFGGPKNVRPPDNEERLRQTVFTALAYGLKGVLWFTAGRMFEPGTAELNDCGRDIANINRDLSVIGKELVRLTPVDVHHTAPLPRGVREVPEDYWLQPTCYLSYGVCMGTFKDNGGVDYVLLANKNHDIEMRVALEIARRVPVTAVHRLDKRRGALIEVPVTGMVSEEYRDEFALAYDMYMYSSRTGGNTITYKDVRDKWVVRHEGKQYVEIDLAKGDGELLRITRDMSFESIRQQKSPSEKF